MMPIYYKASIILASAPGKGGGGGGGGAGGYSVYFWEGYTTGTLNPYPIPDHVKLILKPYTRTDTENPHPIPDLLLLELYHY